MCNLVCGALEQWDEDLSLVHELVFWNPFVFFNFFSLPSSHTDDLDSSVVNLRGGDRLKSLPNGYVSEGNI